jgi:hypothetical protein
MEIKMGKTVKNEQMRVNPDKFMYNQDEYTSYILGFLWADGYLRSSGYGIGCEILKTTFDDISHILYKTGNWYSRNFHRNYLIIYQKLFINISLWDGLMETVIITIKVLVFNSVYLEHMNRIGRLSRDFAKLTILNIQYKD